MTKIRVEVGLLYRNRVRAMLDFRNVEYREYKSILSSIFVGTITKGNEQAVYEEMKGMFGEK